VSPATDLLEAAAPLRCAVWGTGHMGAELTRAAVARGDVQPVAAIVTDPAKAGRDLGELAGLPAPLGVAATLDADAVLAREDVDVVFFCGNASTQEIAGALARVVRAGKEAVTFSALAHPPTALGSGAARELDRVAREAGHRILGTGLAPGFLLDALPVVLASACVDWTAITARAVLPMDDWGEMTLDAYGIGKPPGAHQPTTSRLSFMESVGVIVEALGVDVADSEERFEPIVSERRRAGRRVVVEPGTSGGVRRVHRATTSAGRTVTVEIIAVYLLDEERDGLREEYVVEVEGGAGSGARAALTGGWSPDPYPATAACGLNALPGLLSLAPGLYNAAQVPFAVRRGTWPTVVATT
jgi:2,4-diaminopentanoate dehydrogenase